MKTSWNYDADQITITFDASVVQSSILKKKIEELGYEAKAAEKVPGKRAPTKRMSLEKSIPSDLQAALARAEKDNHLVVVDFWATWCAPCIKLKKTTLQNPLVTQLLEGVELVFVDLDQHPELGKLWGVHSVPDVLFIDSRGRVFDRLKSYEAPGPFGKRLEAAIAEHSRTSEK